MSLINSPVLEEDQVEEITLLNPYQAQTFLQDKGSILNVKAIGKYGQLFNIAIQAADEADCNKRALCSGLSATPSSSKPGKTMGSCVKPLRYTSSTSPPFQRPPSATKKQKSCLSYFKDIELHTIELSKFEQKLPLELQGFCR